MQSPESRAEDEYTNFGVGNINTTGNPFVRNSLSSFGPSQCDGASKKPEVMAPGTDIYSSVGSDGQNNISKLTGTSMAAPHVSGTVALMRQANPDLTVNEIKQILFDTATDYGSSGNDNYYGYGMIDAYWAVLMALNDPLATARYHNASQNSGATYSNSARNLVKGAGYFHRIYSSGGSIIYQKSSNNGSSWGIPTKVSADNDNYKNPSIVYWSSDNQTLHAVWEKRISSSQYEVYYSKSSAQSTSWQSPQLLASCTISSYQAGAMPVISYLGNGNKLVVVYCNQNGLYFKTSTNYGDSWSSASQIVSSNRVRYPSISNTESQLYLIYDKRNYYGTYSKKYNGSSWSSESTAGYNTGTVYNRCPSITVDSDGNMYAAWRGQKYEGGVDPYYSIVFRRGFSNNTWDQNWCEIFVHNPNETSYSPSISNFYNEERMAIVHSTTTDKIYAKTYAPENHPYWGNKSFSYSGDWPNVTEEEDNTQNPYFIWTDQAGPNYQLNIGEITYDIIPKHSVSLSSISSTYKKEEFIQERRAIFYDKKQNSNLIIDVEQITIQNSKNNDILPFKKYDILKGQRISFDNYEEYLGTECTSMSSDAQSIEVSWRISKSGVQDSSKFMFLNEFEEEYKIYLKVFLGEEKILASKFEVTNQNKYYLDAAPYNNTKLQISFEIEFPSKEEETIDISMANVYIPVLDSDKEHNQAVLSNSNSESLIINPSYPNPFNPPTTINFVLKQRSKIKISIHNSLGQKIKTLLSEIKPKGSYNVVWDGKDSNGNAVSSGVYYFQISSGKTIKSGKLLLIR